MANWSPVPGQAQTFQNVASGSDVTKISATIRGVSGAKTSTKMPDTTLPSSTSTDTSLDNNKPVVLVRGGDVVNLTSDQPATWTVQPNSTTSQAPPQVIATGNGTTATLKTDQYGSYSVIAKSSTQSNSGIVWNVVFVSVEIDPGTNSVTKATADSTHYCDGQFINKWGETVHSGENKSKDGLFVDLTNKVVFRTGDFKMNWAWMGRVKLKVRGGGTDEKLGIDEVEVHFLHNATGSSLTGIYDDKSTAVTTAKSGFPSLDRPIADNDGPMPPAGWSGPWANPGTNTHEPFCWGGNMEMVAPSTGPDRTISMSDSPAADTDANHVFHIYQITGPALTTITGSIDFLAAICSFSHAARGMIVVHAQAAWHAVYNGTVSTDSGAKFPSYHPNGAGTTGDSSFTAVSPGTGGMPTDMSTPKLEVMDPAFALDITTTYKSS
jgi:hypothetical protein